MPGGAKFKLVASGTNEGATSDRSRNLRRSLSLKESVTDPNRRRRFWEHSGVTYISVLWHVFIYAWAFKNKTAIGSRGGALVESMPFDRRVVGSNPALAAMLRPWQVIHLQLSYAFRRVNSNTVSIAVVGCPSERLIL